MRSKIMSNDIFTEEPLYEARQCKSFEGMDGIAFTVDFYLGKEKVGTMSNEGKEGREVT